MSSVNVIPETVSTASGNLQNLGSALRSANAAAASQTTAIAAPAADEVSSAISAVLGAHAQEFQALSAKAAAFHDEFVNLLNGGAAQYLNAEAANAQQALANGVTAPAGGVAGAAANAADTVDNTLGAINLNYPLGPLEMSLSATPIFVSDGMGGSMLSGLIGAGAVTYNLPWASGVLASANVSEGFSPTGGWFGHILETWPLGAWVSVDGTGSFFPLGISSLAYNFDGLEISIPGTGLLGPFVPNVTWNPNP